METIAEALQREGREAGIALGMERGMERGMEQGMQREAASLVLRQLNRRFGNLSTQQQEQIQGLPTQRLEDLGEALLDFTSTADLENWLSEGN